MVGWVKRSATQQQTFYVGFGGVKRSYPLSGNPSAWLALNGQVRDCRETRPRHCPPQPTQFKGF
jgi:hypothetical protein